ncbi:MAG: hypothetical protein V3S20_07845 [Dehalococcoidia bacterium]
MSIQKQEMSVESRQQWLDEELRRANAALHKVEHELEQALNQIFNLDSGLRKLEESIGDAAGVVTALPGIHEVIRELRSQVDRLQDRQNVLASQGEEAGRMQRADQERERRERATLLSQTEMAARTVNQFESRIQLLEESLHHVEEAVAAVHLAQETLARDTEELRSRGDRNLETALRLEHEIGAITAEIEALQKRDGEIEEKVNLYEEKVHRQDERAEKLEEHLSLPLEIKEQLDRARFERQQLTERLGKLETHANALTERTAEFVQGLSRVDQHTQGQTARLLEIAEDVREQREAVSEQMKRLVQTMGRQRRRQAEALAQEIKELNRSELNSKQ